MTINVHSIPYRTFISINKSDNTPKILESSHLNRQKFCVFLPNPAIKEVSDNVDNNIMISKKYCGRCVVDCRGGTN